MSADAKLQKAVLAELNWDPSVPAGQIGVIAEGGVITLTGRVSSYAAKYAADRAAARVDGVKAIAEGLDVQLDDRVKRGDEAIASAIVERLSWDTTVPNDTVQPRSRTVGSACAAKCIGISRRAPSRPRSVRLRA